MCPRPPIPITATLLVASIPNRRIGAKTVTPPQSSGRRHGAVHPFGQREREPAVEADAIGDAAVVSHAGRLLLAAEVLLAAEAEVALEAGAALPADADPLPDGQVRDRRARTRRPSPQSRGPGRAGSCCGPSRRRSGGCRCGRGRSARSRSRRRSAPARCGSYSNGSSGPALASAACALNGHYAARAARNRCVRCSVIIAPTCSCAQRAVNVWSVPFSRCGGSWEPSQSAPSRGRSSRRRNRRRGRARSRTGRCRRPARPSTAGSRARRSRDAARCGRSGDARRPSAS